MARDGLYTGNAGAIAGIAKDRDFRYLASKRQTQEQFLIAMDGVNAENAGAIFGQPAS